MAYRFIDGMNSRINFGPDAFNIGSGDCTYELRFTSDKADGYFFAKNKADGNLDNRLIARMDEGKFRMYIDWETGSTGLTCGTRVDDNVEHVVSIVLDRDGHMTIYLDGVVDGVMDISDHVNVNFVTTWPFLFNGNLSSSDVFSTHSFQGVMDEFRYWNHARTVEQINDLKNVKCVGDEDGLVGLVMFDDAMDIIVAEIKQDPDNSNLLHNWPWDGLWIRHDFKANVTGTVDRAVTYHSAFRDWAIDDGITVQIWEDGGTVELANGYRPAGDYDTSHHRPRIFDLGGGAAVTAGEDYHIVTLSHRTPQGQSEQYYASEKTLLAEGDTGRRTSNNQGESWGGEHSSHAIPYMVLAFDGEGDGLTVTDSVDETNTGTISGTRMWYEPFDYPDNTTEEPAVYKVAVWVDGEWVQVDLRDIYHWNGSEWEGINNIKNNQHGIWF